MQSLDGIIHEGKLVWSSDRLQEHLQPNSNLPLEVRYAAPDRWPALTRVEVVDQDHSHEVWMELEPLHLPGQVGCCLVSEVPSTLEQLEALRQAAYTDSATGLLNKRAFEKALCEAASQDTPMALVVIDLNGLKQINDQRGHHVGDHFIAEVGQQLMAHLRSTDQAFRVGGDEFTVLMQDLEPAQVHIVLSRMENIRLMVEKNTNGIGGFSAGVAFHPHESQQDARLWLQLADERMYQSKQQQKLHQARPGFVSSVNRRAVFESMNATLDLLYARKSPDLDYWHLMLEFAVQMVPSAQGGSMDLWNGRAFVRSVQLGYSDAVLGVQYEVEHQLSWYQGTESQWRLGQPRILRGNQSISKLSIESADLTENNSDGFSETHSFNPERQRYSRVGDIRCNINAPIVFDGVVYGHLSLDNFVSEHAFQEDSRLAARELVKQYATVCHLLALPGCQQHQTVP